MVVNGNESSRILNYDVATPRETLENLDTQAVKQIIINNAKDIWLENKGSPSVQQKIDQDESPDTPGKKSDGQPENELHLTDGKSKVDIVYASVLKPDNKQAHTVTVALERTLPDGHSMEKIIVKTAVKKPDEVGVNDSLFNVQREITSPVAGMQLFEVTYAINRTDGGNGLGTFIGSCEDDIKYDHNVQSTDSMVSVSWFFEQVRNIAAHKQN